MMPVLPVAHERLQYLLEVTVACLSRHTTNPEILFPKDYLVTLSVDPRDQGRCIGKQGNTIWSMQAMIWVAGLAQAGHPYQLNLLEPAKQAPPFSMPFKFTSKWNREKINKMLAAISEICLPCHSSFTVEDTEKTAATVKFTIEKYLQTALSDPDFQEAAGILIRAAGMNQGVALKTEVVFE